MTRILQKHLLTCIGKGQPHAQRQKLSQAATEKKNYSCCKPDEIHSVWKRHMTLVDPLIDGMFNSELFCIKC